MSSGNGDWNGPSHLLGVVSAMAKAAMKDADPAIAERSESLVVGLSSRAQDPVVLVGAGGAIQRRERPAVASVGELTVAGVASKNHMSGARRFGNRSHPRIRPATFSIYVAVRVVPELTDNPGAEDKTEPWQAEVERGVRVQLKRLGQLLFQCCRLGIELANHLDAGLDDDCIRRDQRRRLLQARLAKDGLQLHCPCL